MINKIYVMIKSFIQENYLILLLYLVLIAGLTYPLPYYIYTSGGLINVSNKIEIENGNKINGSYNLCYVEQLQATIPSYLLSYIMPNWERVRISDLVADEEENEEEIKLRDKIYLDTANQSAIITAFENANLDYEVLTSNPIIIYVLKEADTDLKIGDEILEIDSKKIEKREDILNYIKEKEIGTKVSIKVKNNGKEYNRYAKIIKYNNEKILGISIESNKILNTNPEVKLKFSNSESGPSGGLVLSLAIYDYLNEEDMAKGLKISGTGTIDEEGNVGSIGGVKYKLSGAVKNKADIFFVPAGENYNEAINLQKKNNYKIKIVGVNNFKEAIEYLKNIK